MISSPILRLIERMVRSGASTNWFRAARPTSRRPCGSRPTTEGKIGSPSSSASTTGRPSRMTATSLLVVPRSIPMMVSMKVSLLGINSARMRMEFVRERRVAYLTHDSPQCANHPAMPRSKGGDRGRTLLFDRPLKSVSGMTRLQIAVGVAPHPQPRGGQLGYRPSCGVRTRRASVTRGPRRTGAPDRARYNRDGPRRRPPRADGRGRPPPR